MTANLPPDVQAVFDRFATTEFVTVDARGHPVARVASSRHHREEGCIDVLAESADAERDAHVALLFSEASGPAPMVLVQGTAAAAGGALHVRPERVYVWPDGNVTSEPQLLDSHMEEVRSGHSEEPEGPHAAPAGGVTLWDERLSTLIAEEATAVLALIGPDGFPFAVRVPVRADPGASIVRIASEPVGVPLEPGPASLRAEVGVHVRGDLVRLDDGGWAVAPHELDSEG
jgi:hypothetical protein